MYKTLTCRCIPIKSKKDIIVFLLGISSMLMGGLIYLFYRPHSLVMFSWLKYIHYDEMFKCQHIQTGSLQTEIIIYSLPNGLWLFSGLLFLGLIWRFYSKCFCFYSSILIIGSLLFELFQITGIIPGKFDAFDLLSLGLFSFLGFMFYILFIRRVQNED